ncbi:probable U3 small nucleolar RNA-associated protein 11 [Asparagus officinalis]|uniref:probable U3 small nucleolar RNA-associated protein 11 n=1 Tax=Asparagus officinalis TaxID=4686 RepID=UPI00098E5802|nr:probable U3 small nucleolar RNA-associated protein 11 [Asparagus officinalis]
MSGKKLRIYDQSHLRAAIRMFFIKVPNRIKKRTACSYAEVESRKQRVQQLEKLYSDMALQKELQKSGRKRKLREEELVSPTSRPVYKWRTERKRRNMRQHSFADDFTMLVAPQLFW